MARVLPSRLVGAALRCGPGLVGAREGGAAPSRLCVGGSGTSPVVPLARREKGPRRRAAPGKLVRLALALGMLLLLVAPPSGADPGPNLLPDPSFESPDLKAWRGTPNRVLLDDTTASEGTRSYCLQAAPEYSLTHLELVAPLALQPWSWYELSYAYRIEPPVRLTFSLGETDATGSTYSRAYSELGPRHPPSGQFRRVAFRFLTRPDSKELRLSADAYCGSPLFLPGRVWLDEVALRLIGPADLREPKEVPLYDPSFEGNHFDGYAMHEEYLNLPSPTAKDGRQVIRKAQPGEGRFVMSLLQKEEPPCGSLYRAAIWARGEGRAFVDFATERGTRREWAPGEAPKRCPLDRNEWRQVSMEIVFDRPGEVITGINVWLWGDVEFDLACLTRVR